MFRQPLQPVLAGTQTQVTLPLLGSLLPSSLISSFSSSFLLLPWLFLHLLQGPHSQEYAWGAEQSAGARTKGHRLGAEQQGFMPSQFGGWKSKIQVSVGLVSLEAPLLVLQMVPPICVPSWPFLCKHTPPASPTPHSPLIRMPVSWVKVHPNKLS